MLQPQGLYPQSLNPFYPQGLNPFYSQGLNPSYPQGINPQGFYPQGGFNYPQAGFHSQGGVLQGGQQSGTGDFANTLYGLPQHAFVQGPSPPANWQHPAQQAIQQQLAQQLAAQLGTPSAGGAIGGLSNGTGAQATGAWPQHNHPGQINPTMQQQWTQQPSFQQLAPLQWTQQPSFQQLAPLQWTQQPSFQQLAQHHHAIAQQLLQLAAQQTLQGMASPYAGQFIPGQAAPFITAAMGGNFVPGITMH